MDGWLATAPSLTLVEENHAAQKSHIFHVFCQVIVDVNLDRL